MKENLIKSNKNIHESIFEDKNGITLVALVITIILLLILAGITIYQLTERGIIEKAKIANKESIKGQIKEEIKLKLMEIITECTSEGKDITNKIIKEGLEDKLTEIEVLEDLTGTYKGYKYEIDKNFNVYILESDKNDFMKIDINKKVGTSYITIDAQATSTQGEIIKYEYIIDGVIYESTESIYEIKNLEQESKHTIEVVAIDEKGNRKNSHKENIKTESRTYLYKDGNDNTELTGGWTGKSIVGYGVNYGEWDRGEDYLYVKNTSSEDMYSSNYYTGWITNNQIDLK